MSTNTRVPTDYEIDTVCEHAMRRWFEINGRSWEEYGPADAQRREWIKQALLTPAEEHERVTPERANWKSPRAADLKPVAVATDAGRPALGSALGDRITALSISEGAA